MAAVTLMETRTSKALREQIAACQGVYSAAATARHFGVDSSTVTAIWRSGEELDVVEPPNIWGEKPTTELVRRDAFILSTRGMKLDEIASTLGLSTMTVYKILETFNEQDHWRTRLRVPKRIESRPCTEEGCGNVSRLDNSGLCSTHYARAWRAQKRAKAATPEAGEESRPLGVVDYTNQRLPLWLRVTGYALHHPGERLRVGQLREALDASASDVSRAIRAAVSKGLLEPTSTARCLHPKQAH